MDARSRRRRRCAHRDCSWWSLVAQTRRRRASTRPLDHRRAAASIRGARVTRGDAQERCAAGCRRDQRSRRRRWPGAGTRCTGRGHIRHDRCGDFVNRRLHLGREGGSGHWVPSVAACFCRHSRDEPSRTPDVQSREHEPGPYQASFRGSRPAIGLPEFGSITSVLPPATTSRHQPRRHLCSIPQRRASPMPGFATRPVLAYRPFLWSMTRQTQGATPQTVSKPHFRSWVELLKGGQ